MSLKFVFVTPSSEDNPWLDDCIRSVKSQDRESDHIVIIDKAKKGACRNHFEALQTIEPSKDTIVIHLDGDDFLIRPDVLNILAKVYSDPNIWATYGNYVSREKSVCRPIPTFSFRESILKGGWGWSHLRTFRAHLIPYLNESSMKDSSGNWFSSAPDVAIFLPVLELAGKDRVKFVDEDLVYYRIHSNNEHSNNLKLQDQVRCAVELYSMPRYAKL